MPKGQAPYVSNKRKLQAIGREAYKKGLIGYGVSAQDLKEMKVPEKDPATQRYKALYVDKPGYYK